MTKVEVTEKGIILKQNEYNLKISQVLTKDKRLMTVFNVYKPVYNPANLTWAYDNIVSFWLDGAITQVSALIGDYLGFTERKRLEGEKSE